MGKQIMIKGFNEFILEKLGGSSAVYEYTQVAKTLIEKELDRYINFNFKNGLVNFSPDIVIDDAFLEVSQEAAREFPIDKLNIQLRISAVNQEIYRHSQANYSRNYNKENLVNRMGEKINITVLCKFTVPKNAEALDRETISSHILDILQHELTHAYNDYKDPEFLKDYGLGHLVHHAEKAAPFLTESQTVMTFLTLLYVLTEEEINAAIGQRESFADRKDFDNYNGTKWATIGKEFDADEFYEAITAELSGTKYYNYLINRFGELFVELYKGAAEGSEVKLDSNILKLSKSANLLDVLKFFEGNIKRKSEYLWRKLSKKIKN